MPLKRFSWKENDLYSIQVKNDCYIIAQILEAPFAAFFNVVSDKDFNEVDKAIDLNNETPLIVTMVLKELFRFSASGKIKNKNIIANTHIELPTLFISKDRAQYGRYIEGERDRYNVVYIDPEVGDQGLMGNPVFKHDIDSSSEYFESCELTGYNTGYQFTRRLLLSLEHNKNIDPLKEVWFHGEDPYPYKTIPEMWELGVPDYKKEKEEQRKKKE